MHISDIHFNINYNNKILYQIENKVAEERPEYLCITGDLLDVPEVTKSKEIYNILTFLKNLTKYTKIILCLGNHDLLKKNKTFKEYDEFLNKIKNIKNLYLLRNNKVTFENVCFLSYEQPREFTKMEKSKKKKIIDDFNSKIPKLDANKYNIILIHSPIIFVDERKNFKDIDLVLCGHTHNGLLPKFLAKHDNIHFGIISPDKRLFPKNVRGIYLDEPQMIISGGVVKFSKSSHLFQKFNFLYPISINIIKINKKV